MIKNITAYLTTDSNGNCELWVGRRPQLETSDEGDSFWTIGGGEEPTMELPEISMEINTIVEISLNIGLKREAPSPTPEPTPEPSPRPRTLVSNEPFKEKCLRYMIHWPGKDPIIGCEVHKEKARAIAQAMGFTLHVDRVYTSDPCVNCKNERGDDC